MQGRSLKILIVSGLFTAIAFGTPQTLLAQVKCAGPYSATIHPLGMDLGFTQASIGKRWAEVYKQEKYQEELAAIQAREPDYSTQSYIQQKSAEEPFPAIIDISGQIRIIDNHHKLYALTKLYGREIDFEVSVKIVKDYSLDLRSPLGLRIWTPQRMLQDMIQNGYISSQGANNLSLHWFSTLPRNILEMGDSPTRSLMSFVLLSFPFQLKGSYFEPHVQNQLAQRMLDLGIELFSRDSFSKENIDRLRGEILDRPELGEFLMDRALPGGEKYEAILEIFGA